MKHLPVYRRIVILVTGAITKTDLELVGIKDVSEILSGDKQLEVATEEALGAALEIIGIQKEIWSELVDNVGDMGLHVDVEPDTKKRLENVVARLQASISVAREVYGMDNEWIHEENYER